MIPQAPAPRSPTPTPTPQAVLRFWFGSLRDGWPQTDKRRLWFAGKKADDEAIRARFAAAVAAALAGKLRHWEDTPAGAMALVLLCDQMTRALGRGTAAAFAGDASALRLCKAGLAAKVHRAMPAAWRMFFYLPLEHSENLQDQRRCLRLYLAWAREFPQHPTAAAVEYARKHLQIVAEFGRFPHRNALLGRRNTAAEGRYLASTKERFGQK